MIVFMPPAKDFGAQLSRHLGCDVESYFNLHSNCLIVIPADDGLKYSIPRHKIQDCYDVYDGTQFILHTILRIRDALERESGNEERIAQADAMIDLQERLG